MLQTRFPLVASIFLLFAEGISWNAVARIDVEFVGIRTVLAGVHADAGVRDVQYPEAGKLVAQVTEVYGVEFSLQGEVGYLIGFIFSQQFYQCAGLGHVEGCFLLGIGSQCKAEAGCHQQYVSYFHISSLFYWFGFQRYGRFGENGYFFSFICIFAAVFSDFR